jgi:hypothetical protein
MSGEAKPNLVAVRSRRNQVIQILSDRFSDDVLDVDEFEQRVGLAHRATSLAELDRLVEDLEPAKAEETALAPSGRSRAELDQIAAHRPASKSIVAVMGAAERKGEWRVPETVKVFAFMGGVSLDLREVVLPPGTTTVQVVAFMGGVEIIVPPNLAIECEGAGIMGSFEAVDRAPAIPEPDEPLLRVTGVAIMGGFEISTRLPGESARQAHRRRRKELRDRRHKQLSAGDR